MAKKSTPFTEAWLLEKNFVKSSDGSFSPPIKVADKKIIGDVVLMQKVNNSPDFVITSPVTEWFIRGYSVPSKKNSRQNFVTKAGKQLSIPSKKHAEYVKMTTMQYDIFGKEFRSAVSFYNLKYPLYIEFTFIRATKHSFDYANALQTCEDIMKDEVKKGRLIKKGWFPDDSSDYILPSFKPYKIDKNNPGVIIKLLTNK